MILFFFDTQQDGLEGIDVDRCIPSDSFPVIKTLQELARANQIKRRRNQKLRAWLICFVGRLPSCICI